LRKIHLKMKTSVLSIFFILLIASTCTINQNPSPPIVEIQTRLGKILIELDTVNAPITATNFLNHISEGRYTNASFYRVVTMKNQPQNDIKIEVIQGGLGFFSDTLNLPTIDHETTKQTGILHTDGTISMARLEPGSASTEIFICVNDQPELDFGGNRNPDGQGFAAFGRVIGGMEVVRKIQMLPEQDQLLIEPVIILKVTQID
jgi:peptidyl-prolyl cis-trans isomerase A (cyclophilin A)